MSKIKKIVKDTQNYFFKKNLFKFIGVKVKNKFYCTFCQGKGYIFCKVSKKMTACHYCSGMGANSYIYAWFFYTTIILILFFIYINEHQYKW